MIGKKKWNFFSGFLDSFRDFRIFFPDFGIFSGILGFLLGFFLGFFLKVSKIFLNCLPYTCVVSAAEEIAIINHYFILVVFLFDIFSNCNNFLFGLNFLFF